MATISTVDSASDDVIVTEYNIDGTIKLKVISKKEFEGYIKQPGIYRS